MEVYVKESLQVLDYLDNIVDSIFLSDDHRTAGYAFSINIEEANTGYSNLTFQMPNTIIDDNGNQIKNPKLLLLKPLVKLRYHREVFYMGEKEITVKEPTGYGDTTVYVDRTYKNTYPDNIIENYIMDYIVQPVEKKRSNLEIATTFTAIDYPRFNLSKKKFGLTINDDTITREDWSIFTKEPMSIAGTVEYIPWSKDFGYTDMEEWDPATATQFPLTEPQINDMLKNTGLWTYGLSTTVYYWPIKSNGRFEGTIYSKGDYLTLQIYPKTETGSLDNDWSQTVEKSGLSSDVVFTGDQVGPTSLDFCGYQWLYLDKGAAYLTPNNACNYLLHTLADTNWTVKNSSDRYCGTYFNTGNFPSARINEKGQTVDLKAWDYLIYKTPNKDSEDYSDYVGMFASPNSLPGNYSESQVGKWAIVTSQEGYYVDNTLVYIWSGTEWNYDYDDKYKIDTKFYAWEVDKDSKGKWVDVTGEYWTGAIDKKTGVLYDVDLVETEVPTLKTDLVEYETTELRSSLSASESNCYNIITSICKEFQVYPIFDCINRTVSLKLFSGKNYGLQYTLGGSLSTSGTKADGEKVITKLRCFGGNDVQGTESINLGDANRKYKQYNGGLYAKVSDLPTESVKGYWAVVGDMSGEHYWEYTGSRVVYEYKNNKWTAVAPTVDEDGTIHYYVTTEDGTFDVDLQTGMSLPWDPNDDAYIQKRSPYGTEYIYNFKWMYDNGWMTKEQILGVYEKSTELQTLNKGFLENYDTDYVLTYDKYIDAGVNYQANDDEFQACINAMANKYYYNPQQPNEGSFAAFPYIPKDTYVGANNYHYIDAYHCKNLQCRYAQVKSMTKCPKCGGSDIQKKAIRIPCWSDFEKDGVTSSDRLNPSSKGFMQQVIETAGDKAQDTTYIGSIFPEQQQGDAEKTFDVYRNGSYEWDKSGTYYNWNDYVNKWIEYWGYAQSNLIELDEAQERVNLLEQSYKVYETKRDQIDFETQELFGDYIVEGKYKDDTIVYTEILLSESLKASDKYCVPEITYNLNVIDTTGLCEYRGHQDEVYNDIVHALHNVGQIVPKPGDYCTIYDEPMGLTGVPGLITNIKRVIDNPVNNTITIDTAYTDADDLVGNIITATNTVLNHADVYARTAILQSDGTISASAMNETLEKSSKENISLVGVKGSSFLDSTGLVVSDPKNPNYKMKYAGAGIYGTVDNEETWFSMMTPAGINANYINAGSIDTKSVQIMSGKSAKVVLDNLGLSVKDASGAAYSLPTKKDNRGYWDWNGTNIKAFIGVDHDNNGLLYLDGQMQVRGGSRIAGWEIDDEKIYKDQVWMSSAGTTGTVNNTSTDFMFYSKGKFGVDKNGKLYANGADISGKIVVTTSDSEVNNGTVGGWTASGSGLKVTGIELSPTGGTQHTVNGRVGSDWAIWANDNFGVTTDGHLYATNADIKGKITAESGDIGGWHIDKSGFYNDYGVRLNCSGSASAKVIQVNSSFYVQNNGYLYCANATIGGWNITSDDIYRGETHMTTGGKIFFKNGDAYFTMGDGTEHPACSGLNVDKHGIRFGEQGVHLCAYEGDENDGNGTIGTTGANSIRLTGSNIVFNKMQVSQSVTSGLPKADKGIAFTNPSNGQSYNGYSGTFKVDFPGITGYYRLFFCNGILVGFEEG